MRLAALLVCLLIAGLQSQAQNRTVTGTVTSETGAPLQGASVVIKGTQTGVNTNKNGQFAITVPSTAKALVISFVNFTTQEIALGGSDSYKVQLQPGSQKLDEVVVTAYGNTQKKAFTGTAATISNERFKDLQVSTITGILQGNASGVLAITSTGQPGENPTIRIRGVGSFSASNDPLIIVDGAAYGGNINSINPNDIETVTILKDASSTALYGSRAANGVIQITTKTGRNGKTRFSLSNITGFSTRAVKEYPTVSTDQYYELTWEALRNDAIANPALLTTYGVPSAEAYASKVVTAQLIYNPYNNPQPVGLDGKIASGAKLLWNDNWRDAVTRTGLRNDVNMSVSGGNADGTRYFLSGGFLNDDGIIQQSNFKRYTGRIKVDTKATDWLVIGINANMSYSTQNYPYQGNGAASASLGFARGIAPIYPIYLRDPVTGNPVLDGKGNKIFDFGNNTATGGIRAAADQRPFNAGQNPLGTVSINPVIYTRFIGSGNAYAEASIIKGLKFRSQYAVDYTITTSDIFWNPFYGDGTTVGGLSYKGIINTTVQTFTNSFTYDKKIGDQHHFNLIAGMEANRQRGELTTSSTTGFTFAYPTQVSYGSTPSASDTVGQARLESYFSRLNYDFTDKYHLSVSLRRDGSTRFAEAVRWGTFYSVGGAWNVNKENFMSGVTILSDLKLKASYGTAGNQALPGSLPYLGLYVTNIFAGNNANIYDQPSNFLLTWEKQRQVDIGFDFGILKNRITGSFVYFSRTSDSLLNKRPISPSVGFNSVFANTGGVKNSGYEIELNSINIDKKDFSWRTYFNITHLKNEITIVPAGAAATQVKGGSWYDWYLIQYVGVDPADGMPMWYKDQTDPATGKVTKVTTKTYSQASFYHTGNRLADFTGGITNTIRYKDFDLSVLASFSVGGKIYDGDYASLMHSFYSSSSNASIDVWNNRWQSPTHPGDGKTPKLLASTPLNADAASTRFLFDMSYLRIRNITVGYRVPQSLLRRASITGARIFIDLQNPFTFFGGPIGLDPEAGINAQSGNSNTASNKTLSVGLNLDF